MPRGRSCVDFALNLFFIAAFYFPNHVRTFISLLMRETSGRLLSTCGLRACMRGGWATYGNVSENILDLVANLPPPTAAAAAAPAAQHYRSRRTAWSRELSPQHRSRQWG